MFKWLGNFLENFAHNAPDIPRPFDGLWKALGRDDGHPEAEQPSPDSPDSP